jgi:hypothetical protein
VIRPDGDHFDVGVIAHALPRLVLHERHIDGRDTDVQHLTWEEFLEGVSNFPRQFDLVWECDAEDRHLDDFRVLAGQHDDHAHYENDLYHLRLLNTTRILEDVGRRKDLNELVAPHHTSDIPVKMERYITLLSHICNRWNEYMALKAYVTQLCWCAWLLKSQKTAAPLTGYWATEDILDLDFLETILFSRPKSGPLARRLGAQRYLYWDFGERNITTFLCTLFSDYAEPRDNKNLTGNVLASPFNGRYLIHLALEDMEGQVHPAEPAINLLFGSTSMMEASILLLAIMSELSTAGLPVNDWLSLRVRHSSHPYQLLSFLLSENKDNMESVYLILKAARQTTFQ